jgi:alpha-mannosidase
VQDWSGYIGQWDNRIWSQHEETVPPRPGAPSGTPPRTRIVMDYEGLTPGFIKRAPVAWFASHRHDAAGANEPYAYAYLFAYVLDVPDDAGNVTLPSNDRVRILAMTGSDEPVAVRPAHPLYDTLPPRR